jgi:hypothetical protein
MEDLVIIMCVPHIYKILHVWLQNMIAENNNNILHSRKLVLNDYYCTIPSLA